MGKKDGIFKNFKSLFVVDDGKPSSKKTETIKEIKSSKTPPKTASATINKTVSKPSSSTILVEKGKVDNKIIETLLAALEKNNLAGLDYIEFKRSVQSLKQMSMDEATMFKSAFATASTMGLTLNKLVETTQYYIRVLDKEKDKFATAVKTQKVQMVETRNEELNLLKTTIADKKKMIQKLTEEIGNHENRLNEIEGLVSTAKNKIKKTQLNFNTSFNSLRIQLEEDIEKMNKYLK